MSTKLDGQMRRKSMLGTALLVIGIIGGVAGLVASVWLIAAGALFCLLAVVLLYQVGRSLP